MEIVLAIVVVAALVVVFFVTYVLNKRTPVPKGCEHLQVNEENCGACSNVSCHLKQELDLKKIQSEIEEDKE